jgi:hypothetical protein
MERGLHDGQDPRRIVTLSGANGLFVATGTCTGATGEMLRSAQHDIGRAAV